jgi:hypothetical protein
MCCRREWLRQQTRLYTIVCALKLLVYVLQEGVASAADASVQVKAEPDAALLLRNPGIKALLRH